jgi:hypothetical protein
MKRWFPIHRPEWTQVKWNSCQFIYRVCLCCDVSVCVCIVSAASEHGIMGRNTELIASWAIPVAPVSVATRADVSNCNELNYRLMCLCTGACGEKALRVSEQLLNLHTSVAFGIHTGWTTGVRLEIFLYSTQHPYRLWSPPRLISRG